MGITSSDIDNQSFSINKKGYNVSEVDMFLEKVSREVGVLNSKILENEKKIDELRRNEGSSERISELNATIAKQNIEIEELNKQVKENINDGRAISEALIVAQRQAEKIVSEANEKAGKIIKDANEKADYIEKDADSQKKKVLAEIDKLEKEQKATRKEYHVMLRDIIKAMDKRLVLSEGQSGKKTSEENAPKVNAGVTSKNNPVALNNNANKVNVKPAPVNPEPQKDFSGFGDTDFNDDKID